MTGEKARITICLPVYNGESLLSIALDSILAQTFKEYILIIVDNASTDRTRDICLEYQAKEPRIRYYCNEKNLGLTGNYNRAFEFVQTEYFTFMACDDYLAPEFLAKCINVLDNDSSLILCHSEIKLFDEEGQIIGPYDKKLMFPNEESPHPYKRFRDLIMINHYCLDDYGLMRTNNIKMRPLYESHYGSDRNFLAELSLIGKFHHIQETLFYWRNEQEKYRKFHTWSNRIRTWRDWANRLDSSKPNKIPVPHWSLLFGYLRSVHRVKLSLTERLMCYYVILQWIIKNLHRLAKDLVIAGMIVLGIIKEHVFNRSLFTAPERAKR